MSVFRHDMADGHVNVTRTENSDIFDSIIFTTINNIRETGKRPDIPLLYKRIKKFTGFEDLQQDFFEERCSTLITDGKIVNKKFRELDSFYLVSESENDYSKTSITQPIPISPLTPVMKNKDKIMLDTDISELREELVVLKSCIMAQLDNIKGKIVGIDSGVREKKTGGDESGLVKILLDQISYLREEKCFQEYYDPDFVGKSKVADA